MNMRTRKDGVGFSFADLTSAIPSNVLAKAQEAINPQKLIDQAIAAVLPKPATSQPQALTPEVVSAFPVATVQQTPMALLSSDNKTLWYAVGGAFALLIAIKLLKK